MREPLTLEQAMRAHKPVPFTADEWDRLHRASRGEAMPQRLPTPWLPLIGHWHIDAADPDTPFTGTLPPQTQEP